MKNRSLSKWKLGLSLALGALGLMPGANASADTIDVQATITGVQFATSSYTTVGIKFNGSDLGQVIAGPEIWHQTGGSTLLGDYLTYCVEINQDVYLGSSYGFTTGTVESAPTPGNPIPGASGMGSAKATLLDELWARHYGDVSNAVSGAAFQVAVWDIVYDADFNLGIGNLQAYGNTAVTDLATTWLTDVNTNSTAFTHQNLLALKSDNFQDQVTLLPPLQSPPPETPLPPAAAGAAVLFLGMGARRVRRPAQP